MKQDRSNEEADTAAEYGYRRNLWNEVECRHHYARSMASWALIPALSGYSCDVDSKTVRFAPALYQGTSAFCSRADRAGASTRKR